jgi:hypothetical protein
LFDVTVGILTVRQQDCSAAMKSATACAVSVSLIPLLSSIGAEIVRLPLAYSLRGKRLVSAPDTKEHANLPANYYSYALRCIGQNLEGKDLKSLELKTQGDQFIIQGWSKNASNTMDVLKRYAPNDIRKLDEEGRAHRAIASRPSNLLSLSQVLRFCGSYVDRLGGRLTRVSWQDQTDKIQSITIQFEPCEEGRSTRGDPKVTMIEELCIHVYKQRKKITTGTDKQWHRPGAHTYNDL